MSREGMNTEFFGAWEHLIAGGARHHVCRLRTGTWSFWHRHLHTFRKLLPPLFCFGFLTQLATPCAIVALHFADGRPTHQSHRRAEASCADAQHILGCPVNILLHHLQPRVGRPIFSWRGKRTQNAWSITDNLLQITQPLNSDHTTGNRDGMRGKH